MPAADARPRPQDDAPVSDDEAGRLFHALDLPAALGVAVSGGPDSTALLLLLKRHFAARPGARLHVLTVDHGLRPSSRDEALAVCRLAEDLGLPGTLKTWSHDAAPPSADIQALARDARYRLLADAATDLGLQAIALAHTLDDVAETFLIRLSRGSGLWGLAAMRPERRIAGTRFVRPLLAIPKARLIATCRAAGVPFVEDPSNRSERFLRARVRQSLPLLAALGIDRDGIAATARRLARAAEALRPAIDGLRNAAVSDHRGVFSVDAAALRRAPDEIGLRLLADLVRTVRPSPYPPRAQALEAWWASFTIGVPPRRTLSGTVLDLRKDRLWIYAEAGRRGFPVVTITGPGPHLWDGRFHVRLEGSPPQPIVIRAAAGAERRADLPRAAAATLPVAVLAESGELAAAVRFEPVRPDDDA